MHDDLTQLRRRHDDLADLATGWLSEDVEHDGGDVGGVVELRVGSRTVLRVPAVEERRGHAAGDHQRHADPTGQLDEGRAGRGVRRPQRGGIEGDGSGCHG